MFLFNLAACSSFQKVVHPEQATVKDGSILIVFSVNSENKFVIKNKRSSSCIVEPECTRRIESHYDMKDSNNISSEYFFDIKKNLYVVKLSKGSTGEYYITYAPPSLAYKWIESTRLYFSIPTTGKIYYLGNINLSSNNGQQLLDKKNKDMAQLYKKYPLLRNQPISNVKTWRKQKDKASKFNLVSCSGNPAIGMVGGNVGVIGYNSKCNYIKRHFDDDISLDSRKKAMKRVLEGPHDIDGLISSMPKDKGWFSVRSGLTKVAYAKKIKKHHTLAATAVRVYPPRTEFSDTQEFLKFVIPSIEHSFKNAGEIISNEHSLDSKKAKYCVKSHLILKVSQKLTPAKSPDLYYQVHKYTCQHPIYTDKVYQFSFSERSAAITEQKEFSVMANTYIDSLKFTD